MIPCWRCRASLIGLYPCGLRVVVLLLLLLGLERGRGAREAIRSLPCWDWSKACDGREGGREGGRQGGSEGCDCFLHMALID